MDIWRRIVKEEEMQIPEKYKPMEEFIGKMIARLEEAEKKYGNWEDVDYDGLYYHFVEEIGELMAKQFDDITEVIDVANMCFMMWWALEGHLSELRKVSSAS